MGLTVSDSSNNSYEQVPAGTYVARCNKIIDLGIQESPWGDKDQVLVVWVLAEEGASGKPLTINKTYTKSLNQKSNLFKDLCAWRGKEFTAQELASFSLETILDKPCMINVITKTSGKGKEYAVVSSVSGLPKGMDAPSLTEAPMSFDIETDLDKLPELTKFEQDLVKKSKSLTKDIPEEVPQDSMDEDIPF